MKNLKKVLALALAFACAFTMFAGAAFTDADNITHTEAVDMLTTLNVINGFPDGSYKPEGNITRAQMAKMIYTIRSGGSDDASSYKDVATSFSDLGASEWAAGYIKYCQTMGIIAGKSATKFAPKDNVTVAEVAKMALVTMGYRDDKSKLTGESWMANTLNLANDNELLKDVTGSVNAAASRDDAAQILYNTVNADCVVWSNDIEDYKKDGQEGVTSSGSAYTNYLTVGEKYLGLKEWIGDFKGNNKSTDGLKEGQIQVYGSVDGEHKSAKTDVKAKNAAFKYDLDLFSYIGEEVSVLFKDGKGGLNNEPDDKDNIYGVYVTGNTDVVKTTRDGIDDKAEGNKVKIDGVKYECYSVKTDTVAYDINYGVQPVYGKGDAKLQAKEYAKLHAQSGSPVKFLLNDEGKIYMAYVVDSALARVTAVSSTKITVAGVGSKKLLGGDADNAVDQIDGSIDVEDAEAYEGIAKDDVVVITKLYKAQRNDSPTYIIKKAEVVDGTLGGYNEAGSDDKAKNANYEKITVGGTVYKVQGKEVSQLSASSDYTNDISNDIDSDVSLYMVDGMIGALKVNGSRGEYAAIVGFDSGTALGSGLGGITIEILKADGTRVSGKVHKDSKKSESDEEYNLKVADLKSIGRIIKYSISDSNVITVKAISGAPDVTLKEKNTPIYKESDATLLTGITSEPDTGAKWTAVKSGAPVFVMAKEKANDDIPSDNGEDVKCYSIRTLKDIVVMYDAKKNGSAYDGETYVNYMLDDNGRVAAAYIGLGGKPSGASDNTIYAMVTSSDGTVKVDGDVYNKYTVAVDSSTSYTINVKNGTLNERDLISFEKSSDDTYSRNDIARYMDKAHNKPTDDNNRTAEMVYTCEDDTDETYLSYYPKDGVAWDSITKSYKGEPKKRTGAKFADDVKIVYVDMDDKVATSGAIGDYDIATGYANALIIVNDDNKIEAMFIETSGEYDIAFVHRVNGNLQPG